MDEPDEKFVILADSSKEKVTDEPTKREKHPRLEQVTWDLNITVATNEEKEVPIHRGLLQLTTKDSTENTRVTILDLEKEELIKFYDVLEDIQKNLDKVYKE